jgi:predicted transcriptional regulator
MRTFFEECKMKPGKTSGQPLSEDQKKLIELMIPVVQNYYSNKRLSTDEARVVVTANIKELQGVMGKILGTKINSENEQILSAIDEADRAPSISRRIS